MFYVYILKCVDDSFYTGMTKNLNKRVAEHDSGMASFTKSKLPVRLVYQEVFEDKFIAAKREKEIKGWRREKKINLINSLR